MSRAIARAVAVLVFFLVVASPTARPAACSQPRVFHAQGELAGEVTQTTVILQSRLTAAGGLENGDVPAVAGWARFEYAESADFAGAGRVSQDGQLLAVSSWLPNGDADVDWVSADSSETAPAGAVLDFLAHRWQTLAAIFAPPAV